MTGPAHQVDGVTVWHGDNLHLLRAGRDLGYDYELGYEEHRLFPDCSIDAVVTDPPYGLEFMGKQWDRFGPERDARTAGRAGAGAQTNGAGFGDGSFKGFKVPAFGSSKPMTLQCDACGVRSPIDKKHATPTCVGTWVKTPMYEGAPRQMLAFQAWCEQWATECLRVLKPGGHMLAFGGSRTWHRLAVAVEDAGFELRESIAWLYGSGFPKSLDVSKAIDKAAGAERVVVGAGQPFGAGSMRNRSRVEQGYRPTELNPDGGTAMITAPATDAGRTWQGWGTALKPAFEPIVVARKPLTGTVAANVLQHGTGALNIDGCRVAANGEPVQASASGGNPFGPGNYQLGTGRQVSQSGGRWPTNVVLNEATAEVLDRQTGMSRPRIGALRSAASGVGCGMTATDAEYDDEGGASRFFPTFRYEAKAPGSERPKGDDGTAHPTVKPLDLIRWLVRLVTPPGGLVLDPFAGSGTTGEACLLEGMRCVLIEREADYLPLIVQRLAKPLQRGLFDGH